MQESNQLQQKMKELLKAAPYLPVVVFEGRAEDAVCLAGALRDGGLRNIEFTMRTPQALPAMKAILEHEDLQDVIVGAGTVYHAQQVSDCADIGVSYIVSPGYSETVHQACLKHEIPYLPGAVTPTEIQTLQEKGFRFLKFFPAEASGGTAMLKAMSGVFQDINFCCTGGITQENAPDYLALPNVISVGMSSITPAKYLQSKDWPSITKICRLIVR